MTLLTGLKTIGKRRETSPPQPGRQLIYEGEMSSNYVTAHPWIRSPLADFDSNTMDTTLTTMNGFDAVRVTWFSSATSNGDRWGEEMVIPGGPYDEGWFTYDIMFNNGFSAGTTKWTGKLPGLGSEDFPSGCIDPVPCNGGWSNRMGWHKSQSDAVVGGFLQCDHYLYHPGKNALCGDHHTWGHVTPLGEPLTWEHYFKINSASGVQDAIFETRQNGILVKQTLNHSLYCNGEGNRAGASSFWNPVFYGGADSRYDPDATSQITFGHFTFEVPD